MKKKFINTLVLLGCFFVLGNGSIASASAVQERKDLIYNGNFQDELNNEGLMPASDLTVSPKNGESSCPRAIEALGNSDSIRDNTEKLFPVSLCNKINFTCKNGVIKNVENDNKGDIFLREGTFGNYHVEAVKVYLTGVTLKDSTMNDVKYTGQDDGCGLYVGIAWNRIGQLNIDANECIKLATEKYTGGRKLTKEYFKSNYNVFTMNDSVNSQYTWIGINLPDDVVSATGVTLVDITSDVNDILVKENLTKNCCDIKDTGKDGFDLDCIYAFRK